MITEPKYLTPYLHYGLKIKYRMDVPYSKPVSTILNSAILKWLEFSNPKIDYLKPMLHPLSDLRNPEYHDLSLLHLKITDFSTFEWYVKRGWLKYKDMELLIKNHFDVFDLIKKGQALDINKL